MFFAEVFFFFILGTILFLMFGIALLALIAGYQYHFDNEGIHGADAWRDRK